MKVYIMRHGQTNWNRIGIIQGRSRNRLSIDGVSQVKLQSEKYKEVKFDLIISSPLVRAIQTANIMNVFHNVKVLKDKRLNEVCQGIYTGRNKNSMTENDWQNYKLRLRDFEMETFDEIMQRVVNFAEDIKEKYKDKTILIVSHRTITKALYYYLSGNKNINNELLMDKNLFGNAEINLVEC